MHQSEVEKLIPEGKPTIRNSSDVLVSAQALKPRTTPIPIAALLPGESPRSAGPDQEHVARLAEIDGPLPAILVRRSDMHVIDGMHRLLAALVRGQETIDVEFFEGTMEDAFLRAVQANIAHGLPLSQADRYAAATRIIASHPQMSDRAIARASGLGAKAVASIRRCSTGAGPQLNARIGSDGRIRPLSSVEGRWRAAEMMAENPQASLREVARTVGISPATASDVRKRIQSGKLPAATRLDTELPEELASTPEAAPEVDATIASPAQEGQLRHERKAPPALPDPAMVVEKLLRDPSLRLKEEGRNLLRLLQQNATAEWNHLTDAVPSHCGALIGNLARHYAATWLDFAQHLDERERSVSHKTAS
ncbi:ParB/RepB/Spo0J family partition protein [Streptosporangium amethystogenes]|uniref:ParB/RepB/Spo0J family partition protein n=1 Tax=Streptosporangium amethystogenes TaxID=2002 RepID=UPI000A01E4F6|nr:ParB/RepB/Spo0J family partition protein [Streptosporangium amethystogenes]